LESFRAVIVYSVRKLGIVAEPPTADVTPNPRDLTRAYVTKT
jgi:hypothetical protein